MKQHFSIRCAIGVLLLGCGLLLQGCHNTEKSNEMEQYVKQIKSRKVKDVEPLPEIKNYETVTYKATSLRSPFVPPIDQEQPTKRVSEDGIHPDVNRRKEILESYPLDSLRMMGTLEKNNKRWALIKDPKGTVYRVSIGNYVGQNHGRIVSIANDKIMLDEIIPDPNGGWRKRQASMALSEESQGSNKHHQTAK